MAAETLHEVTRLADPEVLGRQQALDGLADTLQQGLRTLVSQGGAPARGLKDLLHGTWLGHPLHSALTDIPIGAWTLSTVFDVLGAHRSADRLVGFGVLAAIPTALAGMADWGETEGKQRRVGLVHALLNGIAFTCFLVSWLARRSGQRPLGVGLSTAGMALATGSAWLGGELVYQQGTGVSRTAFEPEVEGFKVAARANDLIEGRLTPGEITLSGQKVSLVLLKQGGQVYALSGTCTHWGGPLAQGQLVNETCVVCPWHGSTFDMRDGRVVHGPASVPEPHYEARLRAGNVEVRRAA